MRRLDPLPPTRIVSATEATRIPSFAEWTRACLYHPTAGFYASGRVEFGEGGDFTTYATDLSPHFGTMVWDAAEACLAKLDLDDGPVVFLEFGGGDGSLARDVLAAVAMGPWRDRLTYRIVEPSAGLRERQRELLAGSIAQGRAEVVEGSITDYRDDAFRGFVFGNEVLDALPPEQIHLTPDGWYRTHVAVTPEGREEPLTKDELWSWIAEPSAYSVCELHVPLDDGWIEREEIIALPGPLQRHLETIEPLVDDLQASRMLPCDYYIAPGLFPAIDTIGALLRGGRAAAILVDYGGTSRLLLDRTVGPGLRVYARGSEARGKSTPYAKPGTQDITWDVDFTAAGNRATALGLAAFYANQNFIDVKDRAAEPEWGVKFRSGGGFVALAMGPADFEFPSEFGRSDLWSGDGLATIAHDATRDEIARALETVGLQDYALVFGFGCDVVGLLLEIGKYDRRHEVVAALREAGLLVVPPR